MNTAAIVKHTERLETLCLRLTRSSDRDARRAELIASFQLMATDCGKIATRFRHPDWARIYVAIDALRIEAVNADESRSGDFAHAPSEMALVTSLHAFAACLGFVLADAATAAEDEIKWAMKARGWSHIHTHPDVEGAIVDGRGHGLKPGVRHRGVDYATVEDAKRAVTKTINDDAAMSAVEQRDAAE